MMGLMIRLTQEVADIARLRKVIVVLSSSGFGKCFVVHELRIHVPFMLRFMSAPMDPTEQAIRLRDAFVKLGPTFVKLGQLLSVRPDLIPEQYCSVFKSLQDHVQPISFNLVKEVVERELKAPLNSVFKTFEETPVASASIAQVHRAVLKNGKIVAVKVQRPGIEETINTDLDILLRIASTLEARVDSVKPYKPMEVAREFALWTRRELNFTREAASAIRLGDILKESKGVRVPKVYLEYTTKRVLTMDYIDGVRMDDPHIYSGKSASKMRKKMVLTYFTSILEQALGGGLFHADPHPANIFVDTKGNLVFLDFGIMGELSESDRLKIIMFISSLKGKDADKSLEIIVSLARDVRSADIEGFKEEAFPFLRDVYVKSVGENSAGKVLYEIIKLGSRKGFVFDPNHILIAKAMYQAEGIAIALDPTFKIAEGLTSFAEGYLKRYYSPRKVLSRAKSEIFNHKELLLELPQHIIKIMTKLESGSGETEWSHITRSEFLEQEERMYKRMREWMTIALILVLGFAAATLWYLGGIALVFGIPLSYVLLAIAVLLLGWYALR